MPPPLFSNAWATLEAYRGPPGLPLRIDQMFIVLFPLAHALFPLVEFRPNRRIRLDLDSLASPTVNVFPPWPLAKRGNIVQLVGFILGVSNVSPPPQAGVG